MADWWQTASLVLTKREPKTPMAFYSRLLWVITSIIIGPLYANISPLYKVVFVIAGGVLMVLLAIWVSVFAWKKPKYLLYGAEAHFEEWKVEAKRAGAGKTLPARVPGDNVGEGVVAN